MIRTASDLFALPPLSGDRAPAGVAIRVDNLSKRYDEIEAVRGISLDVHDGEIFGLIGPDGAGKTTTFQILAGVMEASSGVAEVFGRPAREMRSQTGYLTQAFSLYPDLSVAENIRYIGDLRRVPPSEILDRGGHYLRMFDMDRFSDRLAGRLSGGMKQKLALVCALVPEPSVLVLDEPTTGVDPVSRREFWDTLAHLAADGLTILVATPYLDEAERCNRVALIHQGEIRQIGPPAELRASLNAKRLVLRTSNLREAERRLRDISGPDEPIVDVQRFGDRLDLLAERPDAAQRALEHGLAGAGVRMEKSGPAEQTLETSFVATLRVWERETHGRAETEIQPFPARHDHSPLRGEIAIGANGLTKTFGAFTAVHNTSLQVRYGEIYGL